MSLSLIKKRVRSSVYSIHRKSNVFFLLLFLSQFFINQKVLIAQVNNENQDKAPYVYVDCRRCDYDFIRSEITFVNYVRDQELADIHVFVTDKETGGRGMEYEFTFIGRNDFEGNEYTLKHHVDRNATIDEHREYLKKYLTMGFASYMLKTPLGSKFSIEYIDSDQENGYRTIDDPWNYWVFQAYVGQVQWEKESLQDIFNSRWGIFADRVTENWKLRFRPYFNYGRIKIQPSENDIPITRHQRRHGLDTYAIKSLNDHWSLGIFGTYFTFNGQNIRHEILLKPGIEYSLLPYELATRRSITFTYQIGVGYYDYFKETIFNKTKESLYNHQLKGVVNIKQPWGNIETGLVGSHYLHDLNRRRIEFYGQTSVRLFEGFALVFQAEYDVISDQLALPKGEATLEEVLLKQRELATNFSFSSSIAITYTFGSKFSNIVNTRF
jgi:hypothetical protein